MASNGVDISWVASNGVVISWVTSDNLILCWMGNNGFVTGFLWVDSSLAEYKCTVD